MASFKMMMVSVLAGMACNPLAMPDDSVSQEKAAELRRAIVRELRVGAPRAEVVRFMVKYVPKYDFHEGNLLGGGDAPCYGGKAYAAPGNANVVIVSLCLSADEQTYAFSTVEIHYTWF